MAEGIQLAGYYDNYDPSKHYTEVLFKAGKTLQSNEMNNMQSMLRGQMRGVADSILTDGDIIEGCQIVINGRTATITAGKIYLEGMVRDVAQQSITLSLASEEKVGAVITRTIVNSTTDASLLDPASGLQNACNAGADRLKEEVTIVKDTAGAATLYILSNGNLLNAAKSEEALMLEKIEAILARRTYSTHGNYKVDGLQIASKGEAVYSSGSSQFMDVTVASGKAFVRGYEVVKPVASTVPIQVTLENQVIPAEAKYYNGSPAWPLNDQAATELLSFQCIITMPDEQVTRGSTSGGDDPLRYSPVVSIQRVYTSSKEYVQGTDYVVNGNAVSWAPGGDEPAAGSTYYVTYDYSASVPCYTHGISQPTGPNGYFLSAMMFWGDTTDPSSMAYAYKQSNPNFANVSGTVVYVQFNASYDDNTPPEDTRRQLKYPSTVIISYRAALSRRDVISLAQDGELVVTHGTPAPHDQAESPAVGNENSMPLGTVLITPMTITTNGTSSLQPNITVFNNQTQAISMLGLYKMIQRITNLEYNQAVSDLDREAAEGELPTELNGIFTDGFVGFTKANVSHNDFNAAIDLERHELIIPSDTFAWTVNPGQSPIQSMSDTNGYTSGDSHAHLLTAHYSEEIILSQHYVTESIRINSYNAFPLSPTLQLTPEVDFWIDDTYVMIDGNTGITTANIKRWWDYQGSAWSDTERELWQNSVKSQGTTDIRNMYNNVSFQNTVTLTTSDTVATFMRTRQVSFEVSDLTPNADNVIIMFNDTAVPCSPMSGTSSGTNAGTVKADDAGHAMGTFSVPSGVPSGTVSVKCYSANTPNVVGETQYTSSGRSVTTQTTVYTTVQVLQPIDPIAQSFGFAQDRMLKSVGLYFQSVDSSEHNITVQIRGMTNGFPNTTVYAEKVIRATPAWPQAAVFNPIQSQTGTLVYMANECKVTFDDPVFCHAGEQYCVTILSQSDIDALWVGTTGGYDGWEGQGAMVTKNPYIDGMLFSSSNALTWTAHQSTDLTFNLYGMRFDPSVPTVATTLSMFNTNGFDRFTLASAQSIPAGTGIQWEYSVNNGTTWLPVDVFMDTELAAVAQNVQLRCTMTPTAYTSPAISYPGMALSLFTQQDEGTYISRQVQMPDGYNDMSLYLDECIPAGSSIVMYVSTDQSMSTWTALSSVNTKQVNAEFTQYEYQLAGQNSNLAVKIVLSTNSGVVRPRVRRLMCVMRTV